MLTTKEKAKTIRKWVKSECKTLRVEMERETAYGWIAIWSKDKGNTFTETESNALIRMGLMKGHKTNCLMIESEESDKIINRIAEIREIMEK